MTHQCGNHEIRFTRMLLAIASNDTDNFELVDAEIGDCLRCWKAIAHWAMMMIASDRALKLGQESAAEAMVKELERVLMS